MREELFDPLGMEASFVDTAGQPLARTAPGCRDGTAGPIGNGGRAAGSKRSPLLRAAPHPGARPAPGLRSRHVRIHSLAAAQTVPVPGDVAANVDQHRELARAAAVEGAEVVVFVELSLTGYELDLARELAFSEDDARLRPWSKPRGGPVPPAEATVFEPGDRDPLVALGGERIAVAICAEAGRASHVERIAGRGAGAYLASTFVIPSDLEDDTARLQGYAERHGTPVVFPNYGGPTGGLAAAGRSTIWSGEGELLARLDETGEGVAVVVGGPNGWRAGAIMLEG